MADEEGKMESAKYITWDYRRVSKLGLCSIRKRSKLGTVGHSIGLRLERANTSFLPGQRRSDRGRCAIRRDKIIDHVFDKDALALLQGKYTIVEMP